MDLLKERRLLVFACIEQNGPADLDSLRRDLKLKDDPDFNFENVLDDMVKYGLVKPAETSSWLITEHGNKEFGDLKTEKYEELNKMPVIIQLVLIVVAILAFMKIFPKMFPNF